MTFIFFIRNVRINFCRFLLMLTFAFIASVIVAISYTFCVEFKEVNVELKASLNGYVDWDNSIYILGTSKTVSIIFFLKFFINEITGLNMFNACFWYYNFLRNQCVLWHKSCKICGRPWHF
jgi:hypothetical protein